MQLSDPDTDAVPRSDRDRPALFLKLAVAFEGGLALAAIGLGWWIGIHPLERFSYHLPSALAGLFFALPPFALFVVFYHLPLAPFRRIRQTLLDVLGNELSPCHWWDLLALAFVTGFSEELLFRGVFQPWLGLWWSNLLFGVVHWVTPLYAVWAGAMGLLLGWLFRETNNLLAPILTHTLYDFMAFMVVAETTRRQQALPPQPLP